MASPAEDVGDVEKHREFLYKVLVIGDIGVGKTSIIKRYVHGIFSAHYKSTVRYIGHRGVNFLLDHPTQIGVDFALKVINWDPNTTVRLQLWDIAGQERFGNMTRVYYKEAVGAFIVFDVTRVATFEAVQKWKSDVETKVTIPGTEQPIPVVLLANKIDLAKEEFAKNKEQMDQFCRENNFVGWFETSAKDNLNIDKASAMLVQAILENVKHVQEIEKPKDSGVVTLTSDQPKPDQKDEPCGC